MDADKIKDFFIHHVEKMILVVVILATAFMIKSGSGKPDILELHQPSRLVDDANQVKAGVDEDHNDQVLLDRDPKFNITDEIAKKNTPVPTKGYELEPWAPANIQAGAKRQDPRLAAPRAVRVKGVLASMALRSDQEPDYALLALEAADPVEMEEQDVPRVRRRRPRRGRGGMDEEMMMEEMMEEEMMMESSMSGMGMMDMAEPSMAGPIRKFSADGDFGVRPLPTKNIKTDSTQQPTLGVGYFIAGTAVVPWKELHESYRSALQDAEGYNPALRDQPVFTNYMVERADVTDKPVDKLVDADWVVRDDRTDVIRDGIIYWSGVAPELVSKEYRADATLTMWIPPVLLDDYSTFALHPLIPMKTPRELEQERIEEEIANQDKTVKPEDFEIGGAGNLGNRFDRSSMMDMESDMDSAMDFGMGGVMVVEKDPVEYKLVRFYDFFSDPKPDKDAPKRGHKYVYRVKVSLIDPNFPNNRELVPKPSTLASSVYQRIAELVAAKKPTGKRWTEWSEPSAPVSLPGLDEFNTGPITAATKTYNVGDRVVEYEANQTAKMVVSQFQLDFRTRLPMMLKDVGEGTVLSRSAEVADIVDPITLEVKKVENASVRTGAAVIDIDGGGAMGIQEEDGLTVPGLMLLFDPDGGLQVHDEASDQEFYRIRSFAEERGEN